MADFAYWTSRRQTCVNSEPHGSEANIMLTLKARTAHQRANAVQPLWTPIELRRINTATLQIVVE